MSWTFRRAVTLSLVPWAFSGVVSCKKGKDAAASELKEAGYQLTDADWFRASREDNVGVLKKFISGGYDPAKIGPDGSTALHEAAKANAEKSADYLLKRGLSIDIQDRQGQTPLMAAVIADQSEMVSWLLRQGANPKLKDKDGFLPIMLAAREGSSGSISELAPYCREDLDAALLLAALDGNARSIDALTNYGASVYATMSDGRTPLMLAAENGNQDAVAMLLDIGSSRYSVDSNGDTAMDLAEQAGHSEIAAMISSNVGSVDLELESTDELAASMEATMDRLSDGVVTAADSKVPSSDPAVAGNDLPAGTTGMRAPSGEAVSDTPLHSATARATRPAVVPIEGAVFTSPKVIRVQVSEQGEPQKAVSRPARQEPLIMRMYRQTVLPVEVKSVKGSTATLQIASNPPKEIKVHEGDKIPNSQLVVVRVMTRTENSKFTDGESVQVPVVEVRDSNTGESRQWISGLPSTSHDPIALVEDGVSGTRFTAMPGQHFSSADGTEYVVSDVRPNQIVIEDVASGQVETIPLSGPRG
ncbi:ankyrin repeat domain-containing protein [Luteolibacter pohnpeiensis]|uniref:Ankyrin repeat domain-containing protein n=1 Tax=Luteolibacter pohnpeiensis TaxID=454153 RepID=A0A934S2X9_9BACT|nr:ankyrin repeat domain-containing protein [Luteolibacter pohnpeiensis]MBK1881357.1 ankyrin repeat domain-containing protein [Luteolibacter pohnpeiensis]